MGIASGIGRTRYCSPPHTSQARLGGVSEAPEPASEPRFQVQPASEELDRGRCRSYVDSVGVLHGAEATLSQSFLEVALDTTDEARHRSLGDTSDP